MKFQRVGEVNFMKVSALSPPHFHGLRAAGLKRMSTRPFHLSADTVR